MWVKEMVRHDELAEAHMLGGRCEVLRSAAERLFLGRRVMRDPVYILFNCSQFIAPNVRGRPFYVVPRVQEF